MVHSAHYGAGPVARRHGAGAGLRPGAMVLVHNGAGLRAAVARLNLYVCVAVRL